MTDRTENGRFAPGNAISPGRKPRPVEQEYINAVIEGVPIAKWKRIVSKAVEDALLGDWRARAWLGDYIIGKPPQILDIRAGEAQLLAQVLDIMKAQGLEPSVVFAGMLAELGLPEDEVEDDEQ